jgi:acyl carrier protein
VAATARRPLRGVVHAAGALDDGVIANLDRDRFARVLASKIDGALHLDEATRSAPLDFFVCFSSVIGVLGSPGQANYAAANAGLDAVVARRRAQGRPALSLAWGPWARVGMAAAGRDRGRRLAARGLASLAPEDGIEAFGRLRHTAGTVLVMRFDAARWSRAHAGGARSLLRDLGGAESGPRASEGLLGQIGAAATPAERRSLLETHLREQIGHVLRVAPARVERDTPLKALGLNSLMSLELRNRLEATLGLTLPATLVWNYPTVAAVAAHLEERLGFVPGETGEAAPSSDDAELDRLLTEIQGLSDEEVRRQLANGGGGARDE